MCLRMREAWQTVSAPICKPYAQTALKAAPAQILVFETLPDVEILIDAELIFDGGIA